MRFAGVPNLTHQLKPTRSSYLGRLSRLLIKTCGHTRRTARGSRKLRELMQKYLTALEQASLMRDLNEAVMEELDGVHYATMVAAGFHGRRGLLVMTNAGHPPAFWYRASRDEWAWFEPRRAQERLEVRSTPLGLLSNVSYDRMIVRPEPGDLMVLYSDGVSEAANRQGEELGRDGLMTLAERWTKVLPKGSASSSLRPLLGFEEDKRQRTTRPSSCCKGVKVPRRSDSQWCVAT